MWTVPAGLIASPVTPMFANGDIDEDGWRRLLDFFAAQRHVCGVGVGFHLAESHSLGFDERARLFEIAAQHLKGRLPVIAAVSASGTRECIDLGLAAGRAGATALIAIPPYRWRLSQQGIHDHYATLMRETGMPVMGYHLPDWQEGMGLEPPLVRRLAFEFPPFVGIKDASFRYDYHAMLHATVRAERPEFGIAMGLGWLLPSVPLGSRTTFAALGALAPRLVADLYDSATGRDWPRASELFLRVSRIWSIVQDAYPWGVKAAMAAVGRDVGPMRAPNDRPSRDYLDTLADRLMAAGLKDEPKGWTA
jgi:dihydrodipicolinate synthase/N-acetylneuraminate lyase